MENFDDAVFEKDLRHIHNTLTNLSDVPVEEFLTTTNNSFQSLIDHPFPTHIFRPSSHSHHKLSTDAIAAKRKRRKLERKISLLLRSSKPVPVNLLAALKESRKTARALIFKSRADYFNNMLASVKLNLKVFWKTAKSILHRSLSSSPRSSSEAINLVNTFSSFFKEKIALIHIPLPTSILRCTDPILPENRTPLSYFSFFSIEEVSRLIRSLPNKSSPLDLIPTSTLKRFSHLFAPIISKLTNLSFSQAIFPASFKTAQVLPLLKKGNLDPTIPSNYHPIFNLSTISKIIERLVHSRKTSQVSLSPNFKLFQSAYRKHHSTETTLLRITDSLRNICATGDAAVLVSLDLSAAFDTLEHNIIIDIFNRHFNITDLALSWFCSYLSQRSQFVKMDNFSSSLTSWNSGVPQGSVLGPILFSLYTSPMCSIIVQHDLLFHQFADDITLFTGVFHPDPSPTLLKLSSCSSALNSWFSQSHLKLSPTKSEVMFVGSFGLLAKYNLPSVVTLDGTTLPISSKLKILGVTLDLNLNFAHFISQIIQSSNFHIYAIKKVRKFLPLPTANALYLTSSFQIGLL